GSQPEAAPEETSAAPFPETPVETESFERITDDELTQEAGELLKDAMVQEKIIEEIHQAEYETTIPTTTPDPEWKVGSFKSPVEISGFQRVVDENVQPPIELAETEDFEEGGPSAFKHVSGVVSAFYNRLRSRGEGGRPSDEDRPETLETSANDDSHESPSS